jgi:predicted lipoprotein with Yx(FWY)xxD motif
MRTALHFITCLVLGCVAVAGCRREAPDTGDITREVTRPEQPAAGTTAPAVTAATTHPAALQLVTAGAAQPYLSDSAGRALYYVEGDKDGSKCTGDCVRAWPPLLADETMPTGSANVQPNLISVIERADGSRQVTYNGHPLYHYAADTSADRAAGNGISDQWGQWHAVNAVGEPLPMPPRQ